MTRLVSARNLFGVIAVALAVLDAIVYIMATGEYTGSGEFRWLSLFGMLGSALLTAFTVGALVAHVALCACLDASERAPATAPP